MTADSLSPPVPGRERVHPHTWVGAWLASAATVIGGGLAALLLLGDLLNLPDAVAPYDGYDDAGRPVGRVSHLWDQLGVLVVDVGLLIALIGCLNLAWWSLVKRRNGFTWAYALLAFVTAVSVLLVVAERHIR